MGKSFNIPCVCQWNINRPKTKTIKRSERAENEQRKGKAGEIEGRWSEGEKEENRHVSIKEVEKGRCKGNMNEVRGKGSVRERRREEKRGMNGEAKYSREIERSKSR